MISPKVVYIETTNYCNANCIMCPHDQMTRKKGFMSDEVFKKVVDDCKEIKQEDIEIFLHKEGEPLLDPDLFQRIDYIKKELPWVKNLGINTNVMLLDRKASRKILSSGLDTIYFSVDGSSAKNYNKIRKKLDYETVFNNLQNFFALKEEFNSDLKVVMQMLVYEENSYEIEQYKILWEEKADELFFKNMHSYLDGLGLSVNKNNKNQLRSCKDPFRLIVIYWNGDAGICCWDYDNQSKVGNIINSSLIKVFNNKEFNNIRRFHKNLDCENLNPCNRCSRIYAQDGISNYFNPTIEVI